MSRFPRLDQSPLRRIAEDPAASSKGRQQQQEPAPAQGRQYDSILKEKRKKDELLKRSKIKSGITTTEISWRYGIYLKGVYDDAIISIHTLTQVESPGLFVLIFTQELVGVLGPPDIQALLRLAGLFGLLKLSTQ